MTESLTRRSVLVAGTSILGAVVAILETSRFLRIPFPLFPLLKFDVVGIPMVFTYLFFGLPPSVVTCLVSLLIISVRNPFGGIMKCTAELATIVGAFIVLRKEKDIKKKKNVYCHFEYDSSRHYNGYRKRSFSPNLLPSFLHNSCGSNHPAIHMYF